MNGLVEVCLSSDESGPEMEDDDIVTLGSSDDDEPQRPARQTAKATADVVNSRPLDLNAALGFAPLLQGRNVMPRYDNNAVDPGQLRHALKNIRRSDYSHLRPNVPRIQPSLAHMHMVHVANLHGRQKTPVQQGDQRSRSCIRIPSPSRYKCVDIDWRRKVEKCAKKVAPPEKYVSDHRLSSYHFDAVGPDPPTKQESVPWMLFKCTYGGCRQTITGDYHFVAHLWSHIASFKECPDDTVVEDAVPNADENLLSIRPDEFNDVIHLSRCPTCLTRFRDPNRLQFHYTRCHSRCPMSIIAGTCTICEKDVTGGSEGLRSHLLIHSTKDAPYNCRVCQYRTTSRAQMWQHYVDTHGDTGTLMCPFCMYTHVVPPKRRHRSIHFSEQFVNHMRAHCEKQRLCCNMCGCSFIDSASLRHHEIDHVQIPDDWVIEIDKPMKLDFVSELKPRKEACIDCANIPSALMKKYERCQSCACREFWKKISEREESLAGKPNFAEDTVGCQIPAPQGARFVCRCGFSTRDVNKLMYHIDRTEHFFKIIKMEPEPEPSDDDLVELDEESEDMKQALMFTTAFKVNHRVQSLIVMKQRKYLKKKRASMDPIDELSHMKEFKEITPATLRASVECAKRMDHLDDFTHTGVHHALGNLDIEFPMRNVLSIDERKKIMQEFGLDSPDELEMEQMEADETESGTTDDGEENEEEAESGVEDDDEPVSLDGDSDNATDAYAGLLVGASPSQSPMGSVSGLESGEDDEEDENEPVDTEEDEDMNDMPSGCLTPESAGELDS